MGLLSLAIWTPIVFGVLLLLTGNDQNPGRTRLLSLVGALASLAATFPMIARFVSGVGELLEGFEAFRKTAGIIDFSLFRGICG